MQGWLTFWFAYYPYICLTVMVFGIIGRYLYAPESWNSHSTEIMEKRWLRIGAPLFHVGVLLALAGHLAGLLFPDVVWEKLLGSSQRHDDIAMFVGKFVAIFMLVGLVILVARKFVFQRVMKVAPLSDYLIALLFFINIVTGMYQVFILEAPMFDLMGPWLRGLLTFQPDPSYMDAGPFFMKVHVVSAFTLFALIPFSRLVHFFSLPFTYAVRPYIVYRKRETGM